VPFKSKAQVRKFHAMESRGEIPKGTSHRWAEHTKSIKKLPEKKAEFVKNFVKSFFENLGMSKEALAHTVKGEELLCKLGWTEREKALLQGMYNMAKKVKPPEEPSPASFASKALGYVGAPFLSGSVLGLVAARSMGPSKSDISNLQKEELIDQYDSAISDLERRGATRR
jgi:hypothetical protein